MTTKYEANGQLFDTFEDAEKERIRVHLLDLLENDTGVRQSVNDVVPTQA